jgi:hypothetical protein
VNAVSIRSCEEFRSIDSGVSLGGLYYEDADHNPTSIPHGPLRSGSWDELNKVTQIENQKMARMGDWKLIYDMMGYGQLYDLQDDPKELENIFDNPKYEQNQAKLMAELTMWIIRPHDSLPTGPKNGKYQAKWPSGHNWYAPYGHGTAPEQFIP